MRQEDTEVREVYRDEHVVAFFPTEPATLGHTLVIPHDHIPDIWTLNDETASRVASATRRVARAVKAAFQPDGLNVIQSNGEAASQSVPHVHVHVVPRWQDDPIGNIWPQAHHSDDDKNAACDRLRKEFGKTPPAPAVNADDHRKHLEFIQAIVTRMSSASSTAKGWLLPVVTAAYGYAIVKEARAVALLGVAAVALFALLDANYLRQEKAYRRLYDAVTRDPNCVPRFSLNPAHADEGPPGHQCWSEQLRRFVARWIPGPSVWFSWSIAPFYGSFILVGLVIYWHSKSGGAPPIHRP